MAKKDDFDLDNLDDDWDNFDEPPAQKDQSRNPIVSTAKLVGKSALATVWPKNKRDQVILKGMPQAAEDAYRGYTDVKDVAQSIAAHTKEELVKTQRTLKQSARQMAPTLRKYLPDSITKRVNAWAKSDDVQFDRYDPNQSLMDRELSGIFGEVGSTANDTREAQQEAIQLETENKIRENLKDMKSDALLQTVIGIAKDVHVTSSLSRGVMLNVQRKQLELQYRTLFALQDMVKLKQSEFDRNTPALEAIVKNTALPDYAKEDFSEIRWAGVKRKAAEWINPLRYAEGFLDQIRTNAEKKISGLGGELRGILQSVTGMVADDGDIFSDSSSLSPEQRQKNAKDKAIGWGSGWLANKLLGPQIEKLQKAARERLEWNDKAHGAFQKGSFILNNLSSFSNSAIAGETNDGLASVFKFLNGVGLINPHREERAFLDTRDSQTLGRAAKFDRKSWLSLNEVIPAWLAEINKSIRWGYGEHADLEYDITTRGFVNRKVIANRVRGAVADDRRRKRQQQGIDETINYIDPHGKLNEKQRLQLAAYINQRAQKGLAFDVHAILKDRSALGLSMSTDTARVVTDLLKARSNSTSGGTYAVSNKIASHIAGVQASIGRRQQSIDEASAIYGERALRDAGIFHYDAEKDTFGVDRDLNDPYTLFGTLAEGKRKTGRAAKIEEELQRKIKNGSSIGAIIQRQQQRLEDNNKIDRTVRDFIGGNSKSSLTPRLLSGILYGRERTNFVELLTNRKDTTDNTELVNAVKANRSHELLASILEHVKSMDEEGVLMATLANGNANARDDKGEESSKPKKGNKGKRARVILGEAGLARRWGGVMWDSVAGVGRFAKLGLLRANRKRRDIRNWAKGKFGGKSDKSFFSSLQGFMENAVVGGYRTVTSFASGLLGIKDVYNEKGKVVLQGKKLEAGEYYQRGGKKGTGKLNQLKKLDDIVLGKAIYDSEGNVIVTAADLAAGGKLTFYRGGKLQSLFQALSRKTGAGIRSVHDMVEKGINKILDHGGQGFHKAKAWFTNIPDVYVQGEPSPRLRAEMLRQGKYLDQASGKPIYHPKDISGPVIDSNGNVIISAEEIANPNFKLVDRWGREIKSPMQRMVGRISAFPTKVRDLLFTGIDKLKDLAHNNPLTRWWKEGRNKSGGGGGFSIFASTGSKTNHILIRIYKLLNNRLSGDREDDSWTDKIDSAAGGGSGIDTRKLRARALRMKRFMKDRTKRATDTGRKWGRLGWNFTKGKANQFADKFRDPTHDIATRYLIEKHLLGRTGDTAEFYRSKLHGRGRFNGSILKRDINDDVGVLRDAAGNIINKGKNKATSIGNLLLERLNRMVGLQEMGWFNTMRTSVEGADAPPGMLRTMYAKFFRRNKFGNETEKRDYLSFFRRKREEKETKHGNAKSGGRRKKGGIMDFIKGLPIIGPVTSLLTTVGGILGTVAKFGIFKPLAGLARGAMWLGRTAIPWAARAVVAPVISAGASLVAAVGWPVIVAAGAIIGSGIAAYRMATTKYAYYLDKMRLAQYGTRDYEKWSSEDGAKTRYLEKQLLQFVSFNADGQATCKGLSSRDVEELAKGCEVNTEERGEMLAFQAQMLQRFIPIYLRWLTALKSLEVDVKLEDVGDPSKLSKETMQAIYAKTELGKDAIPFRALTDPRKVNQGFFSSAWDTVTFTPKEFLNGEEVVDVQKEVKREIDKRWSREQTKKYGGKVEYNDTKVTEHGVEESVRLLRNLDKQRNDTIAKPNGWEDGTEQVQIQVAWNDILQQKDMDAFQSLRWKTYGLKKVSQSDRDLLMLLEKAVYKDIDVKNCSYGGDWTKAIDIIVPGGSKSNDAKRLHYWFFNRFLPTFMTYLVGIHRYLPTGNPLELKLTGGYLYEVALMVRNAFSDRAGVRTPVWDIRVNPFGGEANDDAGSVREELETLHLLSKEADLAVRNMLKQSKVPRKRFHYRQHYSGENSLKTTADPETGEIRNVANNSNKFAPEAGWSGTPDNLGDSVRAAGGVQNWANLTTGNVGVNLDDVGDGDYKSLAEQFPLSMLGRKGALNVPAIKQMIVAAAKMAGVPPAIALAMAQAESKFDYTVYNSKSSAGGLFQFINKTWDGMLNKYSRRYGIPAKYARQGGQTDPWANAILGVNFIRENIEKATKDLKGKAPPPAVAYLYHFLGPGGGEKFIKAAMENPRMSAARVPGIDRSIITANPGVFLNSRGGIRTAWEVVEELNRRMGAVAANQISSEPGKLNDITSGLAPNQPANPAKAMGAANDPSMSPADNLPADNASRRNEALENKGSRAVDSAVSTENISRGPALPGAVNGGGNSDISKTVESVSKQAEADGLSKEDAAKVKAGAEKRAAAVAKPAPVAVSNGDVPASNPTLSTDPVSVQQLRVQENMLATLKLIHTAITTKQSLAAQSNVKAKPGIDVPQPAPTLNLNRKAS